MACAGVLRMGICVLGESARTHVLVVDEGKESIVMKIPPEDEGC